MPEHVWQNLIKCNFLQEHQPLTIFGEFEERKDWITYDRLFSRFLHIRYPNLFKQKNFQVVPLYFQLLRSGFLQLVTESGKFSPWLTNENFDYLNEENFQNQNQFKRIIFLPMYPNVLIHLMKTRIIGKPGAFYGAKYFEETFNINDLKFENNAVSKI